MPPSLIVVGALEGVVSIEVSTPLPSDETPHKHCPRSNGLDETLLNLYNRGGGHIVEKPITLVSEHIIMPQCACASEL